MNRTLIESARSMIAHAGLHNMFWAEAISTAAFVRNRVPTRAIKDGRTPYELCYGRRPNVNYFKVFGCIAYAHIKDDKRRKLVAKVEKMRFVRYSLKSKGYRLYDESKRKVIVRRDVEFNENDFGMTQEVKIRDQEIESTSPKDMKIEASGDQDKCSEEDQVDGPRRTERVRRPPIRYGYDEYANNANISPEIC